MYHRGCLNCWAQDRAFGGVEQMSDFGRELSALIDKHIEPEPLRWLFARSCGVFQGHYGLIKHSQGRDAIASSHALFVELIEAPTTEPVGDSHND